MPDLISFARGAPSIDIIDVEGLKAAAVRAFDRDPSGTTAYCTSVGYAPLRGWIADKHGVEVNQVLVTNGSIEADAFLFETVVQAGEAVVVERPTYDRTLLNLRRRGADIRMIELEPDGISVDELATLLRREDGTPEPRPRNPELPEPAGYTLSQAKRTTLLDLAAEFGVILFEDDPYIDIRFTGETLPTMLSQDESGSADRVPSK